MSGSLIQGGVDLVLMAFYTASGVGATGLTVTVDVWRYRSGSWGSELITAGSATHVGDGLYYYLLDDSNISAGDVLACVFKTSGTADQQHVAGMVFIEANFTATVSGRIDAAVTSRSSHSAADVWTSGTRTLTSFGTLVADIWAYATRTLTSLSAIASDVWGAATRTLTAGTNIALAKGTGVTGFNDLSAADVRTAVGLASANLDTQLSAIDDFLDTEVAAIKAQTDKLTFDGSNRVSSNVTAMAADTMTASALATDAVAEIADGVWDEATSGHTTAGTFGKLIQDISTSLTAASVTVTSPVATDGEITIIKGDDYQNTDGRALAFDYTSAPSLTSASPVRLYILDSALGASNYFAMTVVDSDTLRLELTDTQTAALNAGTFDYYIRATLSNGDVVTLTQSTITIDDPGA